MSEQFRDRVVVVTGASRGLGAAVAEGFAARGARVILLARSGARLERVKERVSAHGVEAVAHPTDLRDWRAVQQTFDRVFRQFNRVDVLVNLAGVKREGSVESTDLESAVETLRVNYLGAMACCKAVIPSMRDRRSGHIINVSSVLGKRATPHRGAYSASKAALNALTESLRMELFGTGVHVTLVCPGRLVKEGEPHNSWLAMTESRAAEAVVACAGHRPRELVLTLAGRGLLVLNALVPGLLDRLLCGWRERENEPAESELVKADGGRDE